jgi:signal transduction histidine kinase
VFRFKSIMSRIMFLHVVAVVVTAIFLPLVLYWFLNSDVEDLQRRAMREQAEALSRHLVPRPDGGWSLDLPADLRDLYSEAYGRYAYTVLDETGHVLFSSRKDWLPIFPVDDHSSNLEFLETRREDRIISGANLRRALDGQVVWIQVAEDLAHRDVLIDDVVANFLQHVGWVTAPILLLLLAIDIVIFRRAVQPLLRASQRAEQIRPTRIDVRLPIDDIPREILPLVIAVNKALDRLEHGFRRQHEFTADAAHELRTPLAVLRTRIETLPDQRAAERLHRDVEGMSRVVSQLLDAAELETLVVDPNEKADLREVCAEVAEFVAPLALTQEKTIILSGAQGPVEIKGNAEMLRRAIRNLVENAINHTPKGTTVEIVVGEMGTVSVLDQGEGVPVAKRELIFERFWRRDRRAGGAGLGLSIVKRIVEAHGGTITVENRSDGGAEFSMSFALAENAL